MKNKDNENKRELSPADLRGILKYVPQWRNHIFVIAIDGATVDEESFSNLMLEIAVLRNLSIKIILVYGIGEQLKKLGDLNSIKISDQKGVGPTDENTLNLAINAAQEVGHKIEKGLTQNGLKSARINAVRATIKGILKGEDQIYSGKVEKIDEALIHQLMGMEVIPIISPIGFSKEGKELRINSDHLASDLAIALKASKLVFVLPHPGLTLRSSLRLNIAVQELEEIISKSPKNLDEEIRSKALYAIKTIKGGTPRAHIIDSRIHDGLLMEIFSKVGIGSMIHSNPYSQIRAARKKDVGTLFNLTKSGVKEESLRSRTRQSIEKDISSYYVYEIDESIIACFRLSGFARSKVKELGSVFVHPAYQGRSIGKHLVDYAIDEAKKQKASKLIALTTQAIPFFKDTCGFTEIQKSDLPKSLAQIYAKSKRNSIILIKDLSHTEPIKE